MYDLDEVGAPEEGADEVPDFMKHEESAPDETLDATAENTPDTTPDETPDTDKE
jgi:hypothetical protein